MLVAVTHEVLNRSAFDSIADVADAVKTAAARLRIPYDSELVATALRSVGSRRPLVR